MEINKIYTPITEDTRSTKIISQGEFNTGKNMNKNTDKLISHYDSNVRNAKNRNYLSFG